MQEQIGNFPLLQAIYKDSEFTTHNNNRYYRQPNNEKADIERCEQANSRITISQGTAITLII